MIHFTVEGVNCGYNIKLMSVRLTFLVWMLTIVLKDSQYGIVFGQFLHCLLTGFLSFRDLKRESSRYSCLL